MSNKYENESGYENVLNLFINLLHVESFFFLSFWNRKKSEVAKDAE